MKRQIIFDTVTDLVTKFWHDDRKGDEELSKDDLEKAIQNGEVTIDEIVEHFSKELKGKIKFIT